MLELYFSAHAGLEQKHTNLCFPHFQGDIVLPLDILLSDMRGKGRKESFC